ncbi:FtsX-like permease family protein [Cellulosimicrobium arenosum]|uniref:ABC3 transporter permease C-terminal domain-containing protein n=1 Tax=Cellulosimicrobium arenosum TaxID=2708133 RepID=A0A927G760_9MICO|nr:FtsX-like permease family protein [Cellulosimicrobium arenosum]MBD8078134.1 hypothetical protein [Cellulosimicrobium arenosum]
MRLVRLGRRQFAAHRSVSIALAVVVAVVALVVTAWPRAVAATNADQVAYELADSTPQQRDVIAVTPSGPDLGPAEPPGSTTLGPEAEATWGAFEQGLVRLRDDQLEPLRSVLGPPAYTVEDDPRDLPRVPGNDVRFPSGVIKVDPHLAEHVTLVDGAWPAQADGLSEAEDGTEIVDETGAVRVVGKQVIDVATSAEAAEVLGWPVGDVRAMDDVTSVRLAGTFEAVDPEGDYWAHNPYSAAPSVDEDLNMGTSVRTALYVHPASVERMLWLSPSTRVWYPVSGDDVGADDVAPLLAQLRGFTSVPHTVVPGGSFQLAPASELTEVLTTLLAQQRSSAAILAVLAVGPLGVTVAVLLLGAQLVVSRRRASLALLGARGASGAQLRGLMAAEGLALGLPAAAVGALAAVLAVPVSAGGGEVGASTFVPALCTALAPALLFALTTSPRGLRGERADLGSRRSRLATLAGLLVVVAATVSVVLLLQRGVLVGPDSGGVDPLLAAAPLLLALATALVVVRLAPWPVRALERVLRRRRDLVPFLGAARAVRDPAAGAVPALALVVGVSIALASGVLSTTVRDGVESLAWQEAGADLRVDGPVLDDDLVAELDAIEGVDAVATVADAGSVLLRGGASGERVRLVAVDAVALAAVQSDTPGARPLPAGLGTATGALPVLVSAGTGVATGDQGVTVAAEDSADVEVLGTVTDSPGIRSPGTFVVVDRALAQDELGVSVHPRLALLAVDDGADETAVRAEIARILPTSAVTSPHEIAAETLESPLAAGTDRAFVVAVALSGLLSAVAVVLTLMIGAPARTRLLAVLRTLGLDRRRTPGLVAWEIGPWALASLVVGAVLGLAIPALVLAAVDLTPFTGGDAQPALALDPVLLGMVVVGLVLVVAGAVGVATLVSRRGDPATALRIDEER